MKKGFTLVELLIVVIIIGILATIAMPQYQRFVERSRQAEANTILGSIRNAEEVYRIDHDSYIAALPGNAGDDDLMNVLPADDSDEHYFTYEVTAAGTGAAATFLAIAERNVDAEDGKEPNVAEADAYWVTMDQDGDLNVVDADPNP